MYVHTQQLLIGMGDTDTCKADCKTHSCVAYTEFVQAANKDPAQMRKDCWGCPRAATGDNTCHTGKTDYLYGSTTMRWMAEAAGEANINVALDGFYWILAIFILHSVLAVYATIIILRCTSGARAAMLSLLVWFAPAPVLMPLAIIGYYYKCTDVLRPSAPRTLKQIPAV